MAPDSFRNFFGLMLLATVIAPRAYQTSSLNTISIASQQFVVNPANVLLGSSSQLTSRSFSNLTSISISNVTAAISSDSSVSISQTVSYQNNIEAAMVSSTKSSASPESPAGFNTLISSRNVTTTSSDSHANTMSSSISNSTVSTSVTKISSGGVESTSMSTALAQNHGVVSTLSQSSLSSFASSLSNSTAGTTLTKGNSNSSAASSLWSKLSTFLSLPSIGAGFNGTASPTISFGSLTTVSVLSPARTSISVNQTSTSSKSASFTTHPNVTSLGSHSFSSVLPSSASSAHASIASSTLFSTSTNSGTNTLAVGVQIAIPTTSLSPIDPAAIAGGFAIGEGLSSLYSEALSISDESELIASKTGFIDSIETLKSDLERLSIDLGGSGNPPCSSSKSRFRHRRRSIVTDLLSTIASTICSLAKAQTDIDTVTPDLDEIEADWVEIESLAGDLTTEEGEEEEEESQSVEEERASETAKSKSQALTSTLKTSSGRPSLASASSVSFTRVSSVPSTNVSSVHFTSVSSVPSTNLSSIHFTSVSGLPSTNVSSVSSTAVSAVPNSCFSGLIQAYPVDIEEPEAAEDAIFSVAGAALFAIMGGISGGNTSMSNNGTSFSSSISVTRLLTTSDSNATTKTNTDVLSQTTNVYSLNDLSTSGSVRQNGITTSTASAAISAASASQSPLAKTSENQSSSTPTTSIQAIISTITFAATESLIPNATPSQAIIIYRRDLCDENHGVECSSTAMEYDTTPGQSIDTCDGQPTYEQIYPQYEGDGTRNYTIDVGLFKPHGIPDYSYIDTNQVVGNLKCDLFEAPCSVPTANVQTCDLATDTPIAYVEW